MRPLYLDHCVKRDVLECLRQRGYAVVTAYSEGMAEATDDAQIRYATARDWIVLSSNERHFVGWHYKFVANGWPHSGIITAPEKGSSERRQLRVAMLLGWIAVDQADTRNRLFRWTDLQRLLNGGHPLPGYTDDERAVALGRQP